MIKADEFLEFHYQTPEIDVLYVDQSGILCSSNPEPGESEGTDEENWMPTLI